MNGLAPDPLFWMIVFLLLGCIFIRQVRRYRKARRADRERQDFVES